MNIVPAYGKSYSTQEEVIEAWKNDETFKVINGPYLNRTDFERYLDPLLDSVIYSSKGITVSLNTGILI